MPGWMERVAWISLGLQDVLVTSWGRLMGFKIDEHLIKHMVGLLQLPHGPLLGEIWDVCSLSSHFTTLVFGCIWADGSNPACAIYYMLYIIYYILYIIYLLYIIYCILYIIYCILYFIYYIILYYKMVYFISFYFILFYRLYYISYYILYHIILYIILYCIV